MTPDDEDQWLDEVAAAAALRRLEEVAREHPELVGARGPENAREWIETLIDDEEDMARKTSDEKTTQVAFRLPNTLLERLDEHAERMGRELPGLTFTRVDAVRTLLTRALDEAEAADKRRGGKG